MRSRTKTDAMIRVLATNITSPLGMTSAENLVAVRQGRSALKRYEHPWNLPFSITASLMTEEQNRHLMREMEQYEGQWTRFEALLMHSIQDAIRQIRVDVTSPRTLLVISTTKGNVELLEREDGNHQDYYPGNTAQKVAQALGMTTTPLVVSNACISGIAAQVLALDMLQSGMYDNAIVAGADLQGAFIVSGFNCLKALSEEVCRPFDMERNGLNLGEAAATIVFASDRVAQDAEGWCLLRGAVRNDAFHITNPSSKGDGCRRALETVLQGTGTEILAAIGAHGTATMYNDQMESVAIQDAGLSSVPVSALKGYFGHTMGAAGLVETILTMDAIADGWVPGTLGFEETGVSGRINVLSANTPTDKTSFVKIMSGFGGCNGALLYTMNAEHEKPKAIGERDSTEVEKTHTVRITPRGVEVDGHSLPQEKENAEMLTELYRKLAADYLRFYRMDLLSRLAFVAVELLGREDGGKGLYGCDVMFFNKTSSVMSDIKHQGTIHPGEGFFPSPATFVYTLPNIMVGEVAIHHNLTGSTFLCILPERDADTMHRVISAHASSNRGIVAGWVDCTDENTFEAEISLYR